MNAAAIASSTFSTEGVARLVLPHYAGFEGRIGCTLFKRGINDTYLLESSERRFALKIYNARFRHREAIVDELRCVEHIARKGVSVALPIRGRDGSLTIDVRAPEGLRSAALFSWIEGRRPKLGHREQSQRVARHLAQIHNAADDLACAPSRPRMDMNGLFWQPLTRIRSAIQHIPPLLTRLDGIAGRIEARVERAGEELIDWGFCHGDFTYRNTHIDGDSAHSFDFDWCGLGWRVYDVATYLWAANHLGGCEEFHRRAFVDEYMTLRPQATDVERFTSLFVTLRHVWNMHQYFVMADYTGTEIMPDGLFDDFISDCEAMLSSEWG